MAMAGHAPGNHPLSASPRGNSHMNSADAASRKTPNRDSASDLERHDVGIQQIAQVYARAFLGAAESAGDVGDKVAELEALLDEVVRPNPQFAAVLASGLIAHEAKVA